MGKKEDIQAPEKVETGEVATSEIQTVEDLESRYPQLVSEIRDEVIDQVGACSAKAVKANMPDLYERIVTDLQGSGRPNLNVPGFLLEYDDPFARGTLDQYEIKMGIDGLRLPYVLPFKVKGQSAVNEERLIKKFKASKGLQATFKRVDDYIAFKSRTIVQILEFYILVAEGGGDYERAKAARLAMKKIK